MPDLFTFHSSALPPSTRVAGFRGSEGVSRLYAFEIFLVLTGHVGSELDMGPAIGARGSLVLDQPDGGGPLGWNGIIASLKLVHEFAGRSVFQATLAPALWLLGNTMHSRIFTE